MMLACLKIIFSTSAKNDYVIYDIYKIDEYSENVEVIKSGEWNTSEGLKLFEENIWKRRSNMMGHKLR